MVVPWKFSASAKETGVYLESTKIPYTAFFALVKAHP
jgi:hypothetical protein